MVETLNNLKFENDAKQGRKVVNLKLRMEVFKIN